MILPALISVLSSNLLVTDEPPQVYYPPVQELDLEGAEVRAELNGPMVRPVFEAGKLAFVPLIRLRSNFDEEMSQSVEQTR